MATEVTKKKSFWRVGPLEAIAIIAVLSIVAAIVYPIFAHAPSGQPRLPISSLKQLGTASILYREDWDGRLPFSNPYEFGIDPIDVYLRNKTIYRDYRIPAASSNYARGGSDFQFQFVVQVFSNKSTRTVLDVDGLEAPNESILIWSSYRNAGRIAVGRADSSVKSLPASMRTVSLFDPSGLNGVRGRLVGINENWPPPVWPVPFIDVLAYADLAQKEIAAHRRSTTKRSR